jgi:hypothetical protein
MPDELNEPPTPPELFLLDSEDATLDSEVAAACGLPGSLAPRAGRSIRFSRNYG